MVVHFFKNQKFELDVFDDGLCLCEIELNNSEQKIYFPKEIKDKIIKEVTRDINYKNYNLAKI